MAELYTGMLSQHSHEILFTHGDISPRNIMVRDGHIAAIIDWQYAGWYPEYWEFVKALKTANWRIDWPTHMLRILDPYFCEDAIFQCVTRHVW
jgi:thiamine kinase-like enzyme